MNTNESPKCPAVQNQIEILDGNIEGLAKTIDALAERLACVSNPDVPSDRIKDEKAGETNLPALASSIRNSVSRVHGLTTRVRTMTSLLEI